MFLNNLLKKDLLLIFIILLAGFLRFFLLDKIPIGITIDELDYIINAKAIFLNFTDISGTWFPLSLTNPPFSFPKGEIPYLLFAPFIGPFPFSLFNARILPAILSILFVLVIYKIVLKLFGRDTAIIAGFLMAINPWAIWFGRTAYDTPITVFFYFLAFYILLITKSWKIFLAFPVMFIAFFSYVGTKIILIPFIAIILFFSWQSLNKKRFTKQYLLFLFLSISIFFYFIFSILTRSEITRAGDLITPNSPWIVSIVDFERKLSIENSLTNVFANKPTVFVREVMSLYINAFDFDLIFVRGEQTAFISLWNQGFLYLFDSVFVILGLYFLFTKKRKHFIFVGFLIIISPIPAAVSSMGSSYSIRSSMLFPLLIIVASVGVNYLIKSINNGKYRYALTTVIIIGYLFSLSMFLNNYLYRNPVYNSDTFNFSDRIVSKYIDIAQKYGQKVVLIGEADELRSVSIFYDYLFYSNSYNKNVIQEVAEVIRNGDKIYKKINLVSCDEFVFDKKSLIIMPSGLCNNLKIDLKNLSIARLADGGEIYSVYDNNICSKYVLNKYPFKIQMTDFNVEDLSEQKFCQTFVTNLHL